MAGCDDEIIVEQRTTATTRSDPNVCLLKLSISLFFKSLLFLSLTKNKQNFYLPGESTEAGLISADDASLSSVGSLKCRSAFCLLAKEKRELERDREILPSKRLNAPHTHLVRLSFIII